MEEDLIRKFLNKGNVSAVVGASRDPEKCGRQVYKDLRTAGYEVYPVNPKAEEILGDRCYEASENYRGNQMLSISSFHLKLQREYLRHA